MRNFLPFLIKKLKSAPLMSLFLIAASYVVVPVLPKFRVAPDDCSIRALPSEICNRYVGLVVPIPTFPVLIKEFSPLVPAKCTKAEAVAVAPRLRESLIASGLKAPLFLCQ